MAYDTIADIDLIARNTGDEENRDRVFTFIITDLKR